MSLHIKQLNADATFLLSFEPTSDNSLENQQSKPFTILTDPWIVGPSKVIHPILAVSTHRRSTCVSTLPVPDLVVISQHKSDHCNEATLRQLPPTGRMLILAVPAAVKVIKSWDYFDEDKILTIPRWEDTAGCGGKNPVVRVPVPSAAPRGASGEVTVAYIPQKWDIGGLHAAIGITYTPPPGSRMTVPQFPATPPATPDGHRSTILLHWPVASPAAQALHLTPPTPPTSPPQSFRSFRSIRLYKSAASAASRLQHSLPSRDSPVSVIFSPHGISYQDLAPYTAHLARISALPLTALLHCLDTVSNPWWLGGNICAGAPAGLETALGLGARVWASAHDGDKEIGGIMTKMLRVRTHEKGEVQRALKVGGDGNSATEVLALGVGEGVCVNREGVVGSRG